MTEKIWDEAERLARQAIEQYPRNAVLCVAKIDAAAFERGEFDWEESLVCSDFLLLQELLYCRRGAEKIGTVDGLRIVAVDFDEIDEVGLNGEPIKTPAVCMFGIKEEAK